MRIIFLFMSILIVTGCFTSGKNHKSEWIALDSAESIECSLWPKRSADLRIETIKQVHDSGGTMRGFMVSVLTRSSSRGEYYLPFQNSVDLDPQKAQPIELPRGGMVLGGTQISKQKMVFTAQNTTNGVQIELRSIPDNVVRGKTFMTNESIGEGSLKSTKGGFWLQYQDQDSIEKIALIKLLPKEQLSIKRVPISFESKPLLITAPQGAFLVWKPDEPQAPFKFLWVPGHEGEGMPPGPVSTLPYRIQSQVESWTFGAFRDHFLLAVIDGDTLVGQAQLVVSSMQLTSTGAILKTTQQRSIKDTHSTEPVIAPGHQTPEILMLNWIDEESTIARYKLKDKVVGRPTHMGVFAKGTKIQWLYQEPNSDKVYFLTKNKIEAEWNYSLCVY